MPARFAARRERIGGGAVPLSFYLPLDDLGNGAVNTAPAVALGSPTATTARATTAYTRLASGLLTSVASGVLRSNYSSAGVYLGFLCEGQRTNLCLYSNDLRGSGTAVTQITTWVGSGSGSELLSTGAVGLIGTATAATYDTGTGAGACTRVDGVNQSYVEFTGLTSGAPYVLTIQNTGAGGIYVREGGSGAAGQRTVAAGTTVTVFVYAASSAITITSASGTAGFTVGSLQLATMVPAMTATGPDGVANSATTLTAGAANATILQAITSGSAARVTSAWIKRRTGTGNIDLTQDNGSTWTTVSVTSSWTQLPIASVTSTNPTVGLRIVTSGDAVDVWCFQHELGAFASSPAPTTTGAFTRNADTLTYASASNMSATVGTVYAEAKTSGWASDSANTHNIVSFAAGANGLTLIANNATTVVNLFDGTNTTTKSGLTDMATDVRKRAAAWSGSVAKVTGDGAAVGSGTFDGNIGSTGIGIGCATDGSRNWYGTIKNVKIYPVALTDAQLVSLTA